MKKLSIFLSAFCLFTVLACSDTKKDEDDNSTNSEVTVEKENELAKEAKEESEQAKEEAESTEESVDKLLEDI